jgi:hypothetical protein
VNVAPDEEIIAVWRVDQNPSQKGAEILLEIPPGKHTVSFTALRKIRARIHSQQRFVPDQQLEFNGLSVSTNRVFDLDGTESTGSGGNDSPNALTEHLFPRDPVSDQPTPLSPVDDWTLELTVDDNPFLRSVTSSDVVELELDDIADAVLILEFEADIA